jgi:hypothetical protein
MKQYFLITALFSLICYSANCQFFGADPRDSIRYNEMKKASITAQGKEKVDLLNTISEMSQLLGGGWDPVLMRKQYDTIKHYGNAAYELAYKIDYSDGMAMALININQHGSPESVYQTPLKDRDTREKNIRAAISMAEKTRNYQILGKAYGALGTLNNISQPNAQWVDLFNKQEYYYELAKDSESLFNIYVWAIGDFPYIGNYEKAFACADKAHDYMNNSNTKVFNWHDELMEFYFMNIKDLYASIGDYETAMKYLKQQNEYSLVHKNAWGVDNKAMAALFYETRQYDSTLFYWNRWRNDPEWDKAAGGSKASGYAIRAKLYLLNRQYDSALKIHRMDIEWFKIYNHRPGIAREWIGMANVFREKGNYDSAIIYGRKGLAEMEAYNDRPEMMKSYEILSSVYHHLGNNDSAYLYLLKHNTIKDSIDNKQLLLRLYKQKLDAGNQQAKSSLVLLTKDNALKSEQLKKEAQQKTFLLITMLGLLLAGWLLYRNSSLKRKNERIRLEDQLRLQQLESEKKQSELKRQAAELQMQALRVQMNPHFIFNSLSSINWFIMENDKDRASDYLTRFSRLMRMVLNAQKPMIPLEDELKMLQLYLDMERMRFNNSFDYNISFTNAVDAGTISIPPMLLQPFCENAIWHGFMNMPGDGQTKEGHGQLVININTNDTMLECTITDNGVGRKQAALSKNKSPRKERSLGLEITRERLALLSEENNAEANFIIVDLEDDQGISKGTKVVLRIAYKTYIERVA